VEVGQEYFSWILLVRVISTNAIVNTPAGTFTGCLQTQSIDESWPGLQEFYAPGIGKIKEFDSVGGHELTAYSGNSHPLPPKTSKIISGMVTRSDTKNGLADVTIAFSGGIGTVTTDDSGNYSNTVPYNWSGTVTASFDSGGFIKSNLTYKVLKANKTKQNFVWSPDPVVSGRVTRSSTKQGMAGVTISASNNGGIATTDLGGNFSLTVPYNWTGVVTPSVADSGKFKPAGKSFRKIIKNATKQNFTWTPSVAGTS